MPIASERQDRAKKARYELAFDRASVRTYAESLIEGGRTIAEPGLRRPPSVEQAVAHCR
jgi:hypothetical protein